MTPRRKRHLTYVTIGIFFLLQGVEYAVILPTLWLYIQSQFNGRPYMLGLVLSAFSFSGLISSPVMGRWSDKTRNTKTVLLVANIFQVIGSVMYFMGLNVWFLVAARAVAGLGSGVGSALFADIARVTSTQDRTAVMSVFMAVRQMGLLFGPGCNLFLRILDFNIGPYPVNKYTAPGVFMALLWILHEILTIFMYWNLPKLKLEETVFKQQQDSLKSTQPRRVITAPQLPNIETPLVQPTTDFSINSRHRIPSPGVLRTRSTSPRTESRQQLALDYDDDPAYLTSSNEIIENAERYIRCIHSDQLRSTSVNSPPVNDIHASQGSGTRTNASQNSISTYGTISETRNMQHLYDNSFTSSAFDESTRIDGQDMERSDLDHTDQGLADTETCTSTEDMNRSTNVKLTVSFFCTEFVREEIIAILFTSFVAFFNQVGIETIFTPLSKQLLDWGEIENSLLYCGAGLEVLLTFFIVRELSRRMGDRWLLLGGFVVLTATLAVGTWFIPQAKPGHTKSNLAGLLLLVIFDVFALPFLAVASASLYSKMTKPETQGFAQGIRRSFIGLGTILGPIWAGCMLTHLLLSFVIMLVICGLAMVMLLASFKHLHESEPTVVEPVQKKTDMESSNGANVRSWDQDQEENRPLLARNS